MARATLLTTNDRWFQWEHAMAHRRPLAVIHPLTRFSALPYFIDPEQNTARRASSWHLNHQQAHNNMLQNIQTQYYWAPITTFVEEPNPNPPPPTIIVPVVTDATPTIGLRIGQDLIDTSFADERQQRWWQFQNHMEHYVASQKIAPAPAPKPSPQPRFPFW